MKTFFKSNVKKVTNLLNAVKPNNTNINDMLASLSQSFDADINDIQNNKIAIINDAKIYSELETTIVANDGLELLHAIENTESINGHILEESENSLETINIAQDGLKLSNIISNSETINDHTIIEQNPLNETMKSALDLKQMVDIFNTNENDNETENDEEEDPKEPNNKKKKKKKKKKNN
jgi:hypothetical protein